MARVFITGSADGLGKMAPELLIEHPPSASSCSLARRTNDIMIAEKASEMILEDR
jgi:hypothetical protein